ncbi:putative nuclease HARBI1 isoform X2 [Ceratitis capitata]|nr:putative nuclease HARBI1 isoform X2 [Ceratitis capitata]XP_020715975.1 putative nuclease HARBI1 isoform X2 [Ceratitis capitata]
MDEEKINLLNKFFANKDQVENDTMGIVDILNNISSNSSSESSESSDDSVQEEIIPHKKPRKNPLRENLCDIIDKYSDSEFEYHMRMRRSTVQFLIDRYTTSVVPSTHAGGRARLSPRKKIYLYIWYMSNAVSFRKLSYLFDVSNSSAWYVLNRVSAWIISLGQEFIKWPQRSDADNMERKFAEMNQIPGIIGAIGCTHIQIKRPSKNRENYLNRNECYSILLQAVVGADKRFTDVSCGEPGSQHENLVLRRSNLFKKAQSENQILFPHDYFLLAGPAYPSNNWLVAPFTDDDNLMEAQILFNNLHSNARKVVTRAFDLLKNRFRRLQKFTESMSLCFTVNIIVSACVLHNICISSNDFGAENSYKGDFKNVDNIIENEPIEDINFYRRDLLLEYLRKHKVIKVETTP